MYNGVMSSDSELITMSGTVEADGRLRVEDPVPIDPGPVEVTVRAKDRDHSSAGETRSMLDLAGSAREMLRDIDVDKKLDELRDEWHKDHH